MEGKRVMTMSGLLVVVVVVVLGQIQVEAAAKSCCPGAASRYAYSVCLGKGYPTTHCTATSGCTIVDDANCPDGWKILENTLASVNEYCKLGCVSSVCGAITTLRFSDASEVVNGAVEKCTDACSAICAKRAVETA